MRLALLSVVLVLAQPGTFLQSGGDVVPDSCVGAQTFVKTSDPHGMYYCNNGAFTAVGGGSSVPTGAILLIDTGSCPTGYDEVAGLDGRMILGTLAANANVGTTGGSDTITPQGTISAITQVINHTHTVSITDPGHTHPEGYRNTGTAGTAGVQGASTANNASIANGVLSATTGITASSANPAGGVASITPTFTGTQFDNRSAFVRWIACRKT